MGVLLVQYRITFLVMHSKLKATKGPENFLPEVNQKLVHLGILKINRSCV